MTIFDNIFNMPGSMEIGLNRSIEVTGFVALGSGLTTLNFKFSECDSKMSQIKYTLPSRWSRWKAYSTVEKNQFSV